MLTIGNNGLGTKNERGITLVEWCHEQNLRITNTWFKKSEEKLWTWKSPDDQTRNQIDYILVPQKFRNTITDVSAISTADCDSDHNPLVAKFKLRLQKIKRPEKKPRIDWKSCEEPNLKRTYQQKFLNEIASSNADNDERHTTAEEDFNKIKQSLIKANEVLPVIKNQKHKSWMNPEILKMMEERRQQKDKNNLEYKRFNKKIKQACNEANEKHLNEECAVIERFYNLTPKEAHQKIKTITRKFKSASISGCLKSKLGEILLEEDEILERWKEYIEELYGDPKRITKPFEFVAPLSGPDIIKSEIEFALRKTKLNKAMGPDEINTEMIKTLEDIGIDTLHKLFNKMYETGEIPSDMAKSIFITLPKKPCTKICEEHRTISLMSHTVKLLLRVIMHRIRNKLHPEINECQYGFMPDKGTRNAVFTLKNLGQRAIEMKKDLFLCFIDYKKAFDKVKHKEMICMLDQIGIDDKDLRIIQNLYYEQTAAVKINDKVGDFTPIQRGVRQGCVLSPDLFSLYSEIILRYIEGEDGIKIGGHNINHLRYADDTVL